MGIIKWTVIIETRIVITTITVIATGVHVGTVKAIDHMVVM